VSGLALLGSAAPAAQAAQPQQLPPLVVEETRLEPERSWSEDEAREDLMRLPGATALVGEERIERTRAADFEDVLSLVPGMLVRSRGFGEEMQLSIRGSGLRGNFHTRGVNVLLDGFPFQNADGFSDAESFELLAAKRVEVYKGASALRFGAGSLGGAINLVTRTGRDAEKLEVRSEAGSFGYWKSWLATGQTRWPWDLFAAMSHTQGNGYRDHADQQRERFMASLGRDLEGGASLRLDLHYVHNKEQLPGALTRAEYHEDARAADPASEAQDAARNFDFGRGALLLRVPLSETRLLEWSGQLHYQDLYHPLPFAIIDNQTTNATSELRWIALDPVLGRSSRLTAGLQGAFTRQPEELHENLSGSEGLSTERHVSRAANGALYVHEELQWTGRLALVAGARAQLAWREIDDNDLDDAFGTQPDDSGSAHFFSVTPMLGVLYDVQPEVQLYANVARLYEPPLLLELAAPGNIDGEVDDLDAQQGWQLELGARGRLGERLGFELALFDWELEDELRNLNVDPTGLGFFTIPRYANIDRSRHAGIELGADLLLARGIASALGASGEDELHVAGAYTLSRFQYVDDHEFGGNDLPGAPRHFVRAELRYEHRCGLWLAPALEAVPDGPYVDSANSERAPSYLLAHLRGGFEHEATGLGAFFELRNLTDRKHVSAVVVDSDDGRSYQPGAGRALYGGISWKWH
jgi:iron complex outermembrane receptor protein